MKKVDRFGINLNMIVIHIVFWVCKYVCKIFDLDLEI